MAIRANRLLTELNIGLATLDNILKALGHNEDVLSLNSKIPDSIAEVVRDLCENDMDFLALLEKTAKNETLGSQVDSDFPLKIIGRIDLDELDKPRGKYNLEANNTLSATFSETPIPYSDKQGFWIDELILLSPIGKGCRISLGDFCGADGIPLYSVLIGTNGVGKSTLMKEIVDFFIDLHSCVSKSNPKQSLAKKSQLRVVKFHIDGIECEVIRLSRIYLAKINGMICCLKNLRLPSIVACHFGTFDKFPTQKVNGSAQTRYDVPYYKYVGAHVNGSMISSSAIAFRLLFALNESIDRQRENIRSILDFIGYDHRITLSYSMAMKSKKNGAVRESIAQRVENDREYNSLTKHDKNAITAQLYNFYKVKTSSEKNQFNYEIDIDKEEVSKESSNELQNIYKLKQYDLVSSPNVSFHKHGEEITSEGMSSGEFAMLSTVLSISAAANDPHTLVLLDEPELSLHPNWQMTLIDNLDRALKNQVCHLLIATHSHMVVSDLPLKRSSVTQLEKDEEGNLKGEAISECTYGWSAEEVLLKVFKTATDRNRYFGERIGKLLEKMGSNTITPKEVKAELNELQEISMHLSNIDPMKQILNTIVETYR